MAKNFEVEFEYGGKDLRVTGQITHRELEGRGRYGELRVHRFTFQGHLIALTLQEERNLILDPDFMNTLKEEE